MAAPLVLSVASLGASCSDDTETQPPPEECESGFIGDKDKEPEIEIYYWGADNADHPITANGQVDLIQPPQGGRVIFVAARARNISNCGLALTGALRDTTTNQVRLDTRSILLKANDENWGEVPSGQLAMYANIPTCHNLWSDKNIYGETFTLEVEVFDGDGRQAKTTIPVVPHCAESGNLLDECLCICEGGYTLDTVCDGGGAGGAGAGGSGGSGGSP